MSFEDREYDMVIPNIRECTECQRKSERECEECATCNWCIIEDKVGDKMGSCVVTERYTESQCVNYDEKEIIRKKNVYTQQKDSFDVYFYLILISLNYVVLTPNIIRCKSNKIIQITYYITTILLLYSFYNFNAQATTRVMKTKTEPYTPKELENIRDRKIYILSASSITMMTVCVIVCLVFKKCMMPFAISAGLLLGFGIGTVFADDVTEYKKEDENENSRMILLLSCILTSLLFILFATRLFVLQKRLKPPTNRPNVTAMPYPFRG